VRRDFIANIFEVIFKYLSRINVADFFGMRSFQNRSVADWLFNKLKVRPGLLLCVGYFQPTRNVTMMLID
jgi:hypothetical protein